MVRKEQAEPMKRRKAESQSAGAFRQVGALRRRDSWTGFALCLVLIALHGFLIRARGDQPASPVQLVPSTVTINSPTVNGNTTEYPTEPVRYRFPKEPKSETLLELKGNGKDWTFVQFATLPANSSLRINGHPEGYDESEEIQPEKWYWYKTKLPLVLGIKAGAQSPVNVNFWYGSPPADSHIQEKESGEMRRFTESQKITK